MLSTTEHHDDEDDVTERVADKGYGRILALDAGTASASKSDSLSFAATAEPAARPG